MSTDQATIEALEIHHWRRIEQVVANAPQLTEQPEQPLSNTSQNMIRLAFLAGALEQIKNPLPNP